MINKLQQTPTMWLDLDVCRLLFRSFRRRLGLNEPIPPFNERFPGLLEGILSSVCQTWDERYLNDSILIASAAYFNQFIRGHAFKNGNKRMGVLFTHYFLLSHDIDFSLSPGEMLKFALVIANAGEQGISSDETKKFAIKVISEFTKEASK